MVTGIVAIGDEAGMAVMIGDMVGAVAVTGIAVGERATGVAREGGPDPLLLLKMTRRKPKETTTDGLDVAGATTGMADGTTTGTVAGTTGMVA